MSHNLHREDIFWLWTGEDHFHASTERQRELAYLSNTNFTFWLRSRPIYMYGRITVKIYGKCWPSWKKKSVNVNQNSSVFAPLQHYIEIVHKNLLDVLYGLGWQVKSFSSNIQYRRSAFSNHFVTDLHYFSNQFASSQNTVKVLYMLLIYRVYFMAVKGTEFNFISILMKIIYDVARQQFWVTWIYHPL